MGKREGERERDEEKEGERDLSHECLKLLL